MIWKNIKEQFPKSFEKLKSEYQGYDFKNPLGWDLIIAGQEKTIFPIRFLYDFFDHYEIFCSLCFSRNMNREKSFKFIIDDLEDCKHESRARSFEHRLFAESEMFTKAFEYLERDLQNTICSNCGAVGHKICRRQTKLTKRIIGHGM